MSSDASSNIAFVPTMGALHDGHLSLIKRARTLSNQVVVSIFVNPLQFENPEDLAKYPRDLEGDYAKALSAGATRIWAPSYEEVYPAEIVKKETGELGRLFEGIKRPGHFDGMLTVVAALFNHVQPRYAIFGEKDFQQLAIVKRWVAEESIPVQIVPGEIIRESDGLAMSSRNVRLTPEGRKAATVISRALRSGNKNEMVSILESEERFTLDYAEVVDEETFELATPATANSRALVAGWIDGVRLLDNMKMKATG